MNVDPSILHYGQWLVFLVLSCAFLWFSLYLLWLSSDRCDDISSFLKNFLERRKMAANKRVELELSYLATRKQMELDKLQALQDMEIERARLTHESMTQELRKVVQ